MRRFSHPTSRTTALLAIAAVALAATSCRKRTSARSSSKNTAEQLALAEYEVVDCTPDLCGDDVSVVNLNPNETDMVALGVGRSFDGFALDNGVSEVSGAEAEKAMAKATATSGFLTGILGNGSANKSKVAEKSMSGLFGGLSSVLSGVSAMNKFARDNVEGDSEAERSKTLQRVTSMATQIAQLVKEEDKQKLIAAIPSLRVLAGDDGWINRGDLPRFLPVIPNIVGRVADEKISQGYAEGIADLARTRPFAYRRWVKAPNGIVGRVVGRGVAKELNSAYSQKWAAIQQASDAFQGAYNDLMRQFGTTSYYMNVTDGRNYYDPGTPVDEANMNRLAELFIGQSLDSLIRSAADNPQNMQMPSINMGPAASLLDSVYLPDGVPVNEIDELLRNSNQFTQPTTPKGLLFKLLPNGKLQIRKARGNSPTVASSTSSDSSTSSETKSNDTAKATKCQGITALDSNRNVMFYLYSSAPGSAIELQTGSGFFGMPWQMAPQSAWPLIRGGYAHGSWRTLSTVPMRITLTDGTTESCTGPISHR